MNPNDQILTMLREQITGIMFGTVFLFIGLTAFTIAVIRRRSGLRIFIWLGLWSAMYGFVHLSELPSVLALSPRWFQVAQPYAGTAVVLFLVVVGAMSFFELSKGAVHVIIQWGAVIGAVIGVLGFTTFVVTGKPDTFTPYNNLLAACILIVLAATVAVPGLSKRYLVVADRSVLAIGTLVFAIQALYANVALPLKLPNTLTIDHLGFGILLLSFGYSGLQIVTAREHRLGVIENELEVARKLQFSILPAEVPQIRHVRVAAAYEPMTAVAGDFYEFLPVDDDRAGVLVADVSGHGVPAALIASMIKMAVQTVASSASEPGEFLRHLGLTLAPQLRGQFVTAAYLWIDTAANKVRYSAAGHPPLLHWRDRDGSLAKIESNGLLFGVMPECEYPVCEISIFPGDRFLLYSDGLTEAENVAGLAFGDAKLEQILRENRECAAKELCQRLLKEVRTWQPASLSQQDDITLVVLDVLEQKRSSPSGSEECKPAASVRVDIEAKV
jgi:phosphoserine phosphatase RsbU/P